MIVAEESYETSEPSIDDHIVALKTAGADVFVSVTTPKFAAQAIKRISEIDWHPLQIVVNVSASVGAVMKPAGFENSQGILSANYAKDAADPQWDNDPGMKRFMDFLAQYYPEGNKLDAATVYGYGAAQTLVQVLKQCGDDLTRDNVMKQAAGLKDFQPDTLLPGITINTSPTDFAPIKQLQMMRFKGEKWDLFGDVLSGDVTH
jgi:branched-chain amino acid transport system substrate-binding protein